MDFDGDGLIDVLSGSYSPGDLFLFKNRGDGKFSAGETIKDIDDYPLNVGNASAVFAFDWDGDGDLDLVVGNIEGQVWYVPNTGTRTKPEYEALQPLEVAGKAVRAEHGDSGPIIADWDGDGVADLLVGCGDGSVQWYRCLKFEDKQPVLAVGKTLVPPSDESAKAKPGQCGIRTKLCVTDWNGDGRPDLLVGDLEFERSKPDSVKQDDAERKALLAQYREVSKKYQEAVQEALKDADISDEDLNKKFIDLYQEQQKISKPVRGETREGARERKKKLAHLREESKSLEERRAKAFEKIQDRLEPIRKELGEVSGKLYGTGDNSIHGWVWLFERKPAVAPPAAN